MSHVRTYKKKKTVYDRIDDRRIEIEEEERKERTPTNEQQGRKERRKKRTYMYVLTYGMEREGETRRDETREREGETGSERTTRHRLID